MARYRLHYFPESGNCYKLALMLTLCGQSFEPVFVDYFAGVTRTPLWRAEVNAMGEVPVLEVDAAKLTQTGPILLRLAAEFGKFGAPAADDQHELLRWLFWDNHKLTSYFATHRFLRAFTADPNPAVLRFLHDRAEQALRVAETHLERQNFVVGTMMTIADLSMSAYLLFPAEETGFDLPHSHPAIAAWLDRIRAAPGWRGAYELLPGKRQPNLAAGRPRAG